MQMNAPSYEASVQRAIKKRSLLKSGRTDSFGGMVHDRTKHEVQVLQPVPAIFFKVESAAALSTHFDLLRLHSAHQQAPHAPWRCADKVMRYMCAYSQS
jgi:hypothetical protein